LAGLFTKFSQNQLADENDLSVRLTDVKSLAGLPQDLIDSYEAKSKELGLKDFGTVSNTRSSVEPFLKYASDRALRKAVWELFVNRGDFGDKHDNNAIVVQILKLRAEKAKLLGFKTFADWSLSNTMAQKPEKTIDLMMSVWKPAVEKVHQDVTEMQKIVDEEGGNFKIEPWDYRYYAEKVRKAKYDLDENDVKPYLQLEKLREGMFWVAGELFHLKFKQVYECACIPSRCASI